MKSEIQKAINQQINQEFSAAYNYLAMCAYFEADNLAGFAHWCRLQHEEEQQHAMRLFQYLLDRGGQVELNRIAAPAASFSSPLEVFQTALAQEEANTESINELYSVAASFHDHATMSHLQWFIDEQVEEEKNVGEVVALLERANDDPHAILYLNDKLGERIAEAPPEDEA